MNSEKSGLEVPVILDDWSAALAMPLGAKAIAAINEHVINRTSTVEVPRDITPHSSDFFFPPTEIVEEPQE